MTETMFNTCTPEQEAVLEEKERRLSELRDFYYDLDNLGVRLFGFREEGMISKEDANVIAFSIDQAMKKVENYL